MYAGVACVSSPALPATQGSAGAGGKTGQPGVFASKLASWAQILFLPRPSSLHMPTLYSLYNHLFAFAPGALGTHLDTAHLNRAVVQVLMGRKGFPNSGVPPEWVLLCICLLPSPCYLEDVGHVYTVCWALGTWS